MTTVMHICIQSTTVLLNQKGEGCDMRNKGKKITNFSGKGKKNTCRNVRRLGVVKTETSDFVEKYVLVGCAMKGKKKDALQGQIRRWGDIQSGPWPQQYTRRASGHKSEDETFSQAHIYSAYASLQTKSCFYRSSKRGPIILRMAQVLT